MHSVRVIPRLDIKGPNLVKGIHLEGLRVLGRPQDFARAYYQDGADELLYQDVVASLYERNSLDDIITGTVADTFVPLAVGGGLRSVGDITRVLTAGADKVLLNTAAIANPELIREASRIFGASTIMAAIECIRQDDGRYLAYTDNGREYTGREAVAWSRQLQELGVGEIVVTSVDREGTGEGMDLELIASIADGATVPIIAHGGARDPEDVRQAVLAGADAVAVASMLHYGCIRDHRPADLGADEGNLEFLRSGRAFGKIRPATIAEIKRHLIDHGIDCRIPVALEAE